jgi:hypothetical protein
MIFQMLDPIHFIKEDSLINFVENLLLFTNEVQSKNFLKKLNLL